ncbi:MAG TPA: hypothetical protein VN959_13100, partial [Mycobacterium sp.]|nr:hypothetical protein [Mycobacterium sp.]
MGLIDQPHRRGLGRGRGRDVRRWTECQAAVFIQLYELWMRLPRLQLRTLSNVPIWLWIQHGESMISYTQLRRALKTWFDAPRHQSRTRLRAQAARFIKTLRAFESTASDRRALAEAIVFAREEECRTGRIDTQRLRPYLQAVIGNDQVGPEASPLSVDIYLDMISRNALVERHLDDYSDQQFDKARELSNVTFQQYQARWPQLAMHRGIGSLFAPWTTTKEAQGAGQVAVTALGVLYEPGLPGPDPVDATTTATPDRQATSSFEAPPAMQGMWDNWLRGQALVDQVCRSAARLSTGDPNPPLIRIEHRIDVDAQDLVFLVRNVPAISAEAAALAVEAARNFRSALNYLVRELAWID